MGNEYFKLGDYKNAENAYRRVFDPDVKSQPDTKASTLCCLGAIEYVRGVSAFDGADYSEAEGRLRAAEQYFAEAVNSGKLHWMYFGNLGNAQLYLAKISKIVTGDLDGQTLRNGCHNLKKALSLCPGNSDLVRTLEECNSL